MKLERPALQLAVVLVAALALNARTLVDPDLGWALDAGARILDGAGIPHVNDRTFVEPGYPYVLHGWAMETLFAAAQRVLGGTGLALARALFVALDAAALWWACGRRATHPLVRTLFPIGAAMLAQTIFLPVRAQLASFGLLAFVIGALLDNRRGVRFLVVPALALWPSLHGAFPAGVAFVVIWAGGALCEKIVGRGDDVRVIDLVALPLCTAAATLCNPYGIGMWRMVADTEHGDYRSMLPEWIPSWEPHMWAVVWPQVVALTVLAIIAFALLPRGDFRFRLIVVAMAFLMFSASRHLKIAPAVLLPILAAAIAPLAEKNVSPKPSRVVIALTAAVAAAGLAWQAPSLLRVRQSGVALPPSTTVAFIVENELHGNIWTPLTSGGEVLWACPSCSVSIDGRAQIAYSSTWVARALRMGGMPDKDLLLSLHTDYVIADADRDVLRSLAPEFFPLYCDGELCVLSGHDADRARTYRFPPPELPDAFFFQDPGRPKF